MWRTPFSVQASGLEALGLELRQQLLADRAIQHRARMRLVTEQEGHVQDARWGTKFGTGPVELRASSCVPSCTDSITSRSPPSEPE
jgi:hypothetical protein